MIEEREEDMVVLRSSSVCVVAGWGVGGMGGELQLLSSDAHLCAELEEEEGSCFLTAALVFVVGGGDRNLEENVEKNIEFEDEDYDEVDVDIENVEVMEDVEEDEDVEEEEDSFDDGSMPKQ